MKTRDYRFDADRPFETSAKRPLSKPEAKEAVAEAVDRLAELQEQLYADDHHSLLLIFQGMDAAARTARSTRS